MCMTLGGRAAEELTLGQVSTGALNDLEKVTKMAYAIVVYYGMSEKRFPMYVIMIPPVSLMEFSKPYGGERAKQIDDEVSRIINEQYERAKQILRDHKGRPRQARRDSSDQKSCMPRTLSTSSESVNGSHALKRS